MSVKKTYFNWSSGKDSSLALFLIQQNGSFDIQTLVTTVNEETDRVSMHGLRKALLLKQVESLGLPIHLISLPGIVSMSRYNEIMEAQMKFLVKQGYTHTVFGDIFLEDLKKYREEKLEPYGIEAVFPLWEKDTSELIREFINAGFKAITVSVNAKLLDESFVGRVIDESFLNDLPEGVDPCGENGEFHTFVFDGPIFKEPVSFSVGEKVLKNYAPASDKEDNCFSDDDPNWETSFWFCDLIPN